MRSLVLSGALFLASITLVSATGCGGGNTGVTAAATGRATVSITWPETSRLVPTAASSITVQFRQGSTVVATQTVTRPDSGGASSLDFLTLPVGSLTVVASAYPNADGTGTAQATATATTTIVAGQSVPVVLTMASTISTMSIVGNTTLFAGGTSSLSVDAQNSAGAIVLLSASTLTWVSTDTSVATVSAAGVVTAVAPGTTQIRVTDSESGKVATITFTVSEPVSISLTPTAATLSVRGTYTFSATVGNTTNQAVTWTVQESGGGTISTYGTYTAPSTAGTYHIRAASVADPTKTATATVTVQSGSATVDVN